MRKRLFLLSELVRRDLTARFAGSFGGPLWAIFNPLIFCAIYGFVFGVVLKQRPPEGFPGGYPEFLLGGLIPWIGFQEAILRGTTSVTEQAHLVKKLRFPLELLIASSMTSALLLQATAISLLMIFVGVTGRGTLNLPVLALAFLFEMLILLGPIFALAALNVFFRDLAQILSPFLMMAFYLSPILYSESLVPPRFARWMGLNPLRDMAALFRSGLFGTVGPPVQGLLLWTVIFSVFALGGILFFRRCKRSFSDLL
ncbi:MAG: ABC transporter permease [Thermoanaerobaculia bacterium]